MSSTTSKSLYFWSVMNKPPLPGVSWLAMSTPSRISQCPAVLFSFVRLWRDLALMVQPFIDVPSKMVTKPS